MEKIIQENKIVPYENKSLNSFKWFFLFGNKKSGPYNNYQIHNLLSDFQKRTEKIPMNQAFMIWEENNDIFYPIDTCLAKVTEIIRQEMKARKAEFVEIMIWTN